jgi:hypothetical protein
MLTAPYAGGMLSPKFTAWLSRLNEVVETGLATRMLNEGQFTEQTARAVALSLTMERAAPGSLARGQRMSFIGRRPAKRRLVSHSETSTPRSR